MRTVAWPLALWIVFVLGGSAWAQEEPPVPTRSDWNRTAPVHRIPLLDEDGQTIVPGLDQAMPFSSRTTCGACHDYASISRGFHFNSSLAAGEDGRPGEPWVWIDPGSATQLPLSYRSWPGLWRPQDLGLTPWRFTQLFGRHLPGGDMSEPADDVPGDSESRWDVSGKLAVNCMACHNASPRQDMSEWAKQTMRENFRWAATAAAGLGEVGGMASRLPNTWTIYDGPNPDDKQYAVPPSVHYDLNQFDTKHRAWLNLTRQPGDQACLQCHSATPVGREMWTVDADVHHAAQLKCVDCHRNGEDHQVIRGYEGESCGPEESGRQQFTCVGCHLGEDAPPASGPILTGRLGAPRPQHKGLPPIHLEKLTCTACHSGLWPQEQGPAQVRLSRTNRMGIHGRATWCTDAPFIVEPVFVRQADGKIAPHRMMWPAFWGYLLEGRAVALDPQKVEPFTRGILDGPQQINKILAALASSSDELPGMPVYLSAGRIYAPDAEGGVSLLCSQTSSTLSLGHWAYRDSQGKMTPLWGAWSPGQEMDLEARTQILKTLRLLSAIKPVQTCAALLAGEQLYSLNAENDLATSAVVNMQTAGCEFVWAEPNERPPRSLISELLSRALDQTYNTSQTLTEEQVAQVLVRMAQEHAGQSDENDDRKYFYVAQGKMFVVDESGQLLAMGHEVAQPYSWPLAHDVRPGRQALGARNCQDCHSSEAPFLFAKVTATGPLLTTAVRTQFMYEFEKLDPAYHKTLSRTFALRSLLKVVLAGCAAVLAFLLILWGALALLLHTVRLRGRRGDGDV